MKRLLPFFLVIVALFPQLARSQPWNEIRILHVDTQNWPAVHVKVRAWCAGQQTSNINTVNVRIIENGIPRSMVSLTCPTQTVPISVALALDRSGSVAGTSIYRIKAGAWRFMELFRAHSTGDDEGAVFSFGDDVIKHVGMTTNLNALYDAIDGIYPYGVTTLYDGVIEALNEVNGNGVNAIKAVVVLSDGGDNNSFAGVTDCINLANQYGIPIYSIGVGYEADASELVNMRKLADSTGGKFILIEHPDDIIPAFDAMASLVSGGANDCDMQYISNCPDGSWRDLTVIAEACGLADTMQVRFRAPLDPNLPAFKVSFDSTFAYENGDLYLPVTVEAEGGGGTLDRIEFKVLERPPLQFRDVITTGMLGEQMTVSHGIVGDTLIVGALGPVFVSGQQTLLKIRYSAPKVTKDTSFIYPVFYLDKRTQDCMQLKARNTYLAILQRPELEVLCDDTLYVDWDEQGGQFFNDLVTIGVSVRNPGSFAVENTRVRLRVPEGMELLSAADSVQLPVNPIPPNGAGYVEFRLRVLPRAEARSYQLCVEVQPDSGVVTTCCRTIIVEQARTVLETSCEMPSRIEWSDSLSRFIPDRFPVTVHVTNRSELRASDIAAWIHVPPGFVVDSLTPVNTFVTPSPLGRNDTGSVTWWVRPLERPTSELLQFCVKVAAGPDTSVCCQDVFITASPVRVQMRCMDARVMVYDDGTGKYDPERFIVSTTVRNISKLGMGNTRGTIQLPPFLKLVSGEFASKDFPNSGVIAAGDSGTITWVVQAGGYPAALPADICVSVTAENFPGSQCCTPLEVDLVNAIPGLECALAGPDTVLYISGGYVPNPIVLDLVVRNTGNTPAKPVYAALLQGEDLSIDATDQALKRISDSLATGDSVRASFRVRILDRTVSRFDTIRVSVYAGNGGAVVCEIPVFIEAVRGPVLELSCAGPDSLVFSDALGRYQPDPFQISLVARNGGTDVADSVVAEFLPPPDIILAAGENAAKLLTPSSLGVGQQGVAQWMLRAVPRGAPRFDTIRVQVKARGKTLQQTVPCEIPVFIPAARAPQLELNCQVLREAGDDDTVVVAAGILNTGDAPLFDVILRVQIPGRLSLTPPSQPMQVTIPVIQPGEALQLFLWTMLAQRGARADSVTVCFTAEARFLPQHSCCVDVHIPPAETASFTYDCSLAPDTLRVDTTTGMYGEALFSVTLTNPSSVEVDSVRCTIALPANLQLLAGETEDKVIRNLRPGIPQTVSWRVRGVRDTATVHRARQIRVDLIGAGSFERCVRTLILAPPPPMPADFIIACSAPDTIRYQQSTGQYSPAPFLIRVDITNTGSATLSNVRGTITPAGFRPGTRPAGLDRLELPRHSPARDGRCAVLHPRRGRRGGRPQLRCADGALSSAGERLAGGGDHLHSPRHHPLSRSRCRLEALALHLLPEPEQHGRGVHRRRESHAAAAAGFRAGRRRSRGEGAARRHHAGRDGGGELAGVSRWLRFPGALLRGAGDRARTAHAALHDLRVRRTALRQHPAQHSRRQRRDDGADGLGPDEPAQPAGASDEGLHPRRGLRSAAGGHRRSRACRHPGADLAAARAGSPVARRTAHALHRRHPHPDQRRAVVSALPPSAAGGTRRQLRHLPEPPRLRARRTAARTRHRGHPRRRTDIQFRRLRRAAGHRRRAAARQPSESVQPADRHPLAHSGRAGRGGGNAHGAGPARARRRAAA